MNKPNRFGRGVYVVPTSLTVLNIFFGFAAILYSMGGMRASTIGNVEEASRLFQLACWAIAFAALCDTFDGLVARKMNATSEFGKEYDSIADVVTFGAAPAVLVYAWALQTLGRLGGGIAFLFLVGGSLRLARFNVQAATTDPRHFIGLPIPAAALTLAAIINYAPAPVYDVTFARIMLVVTLGLAVAMVSTVKYRSQKSLRIERKRAPLFLLGFSALLALLYFRPEEFLCAWFVGYVVSGPALMLWRRAFPGARQPAEDPLEDDDTVPGFEEIGEDEPFESAIEREDADDGL
ncbi:MAG: CDP-diacylglycerol--serine O-phosphatidyltransferase [Acidobacteria bacterium]|nr:CDP-diacylglycerol--serine O-phosphatidyltransferase [Acidobacteriota bacterium]